MHQSPTIQIGINKTLYIIRVVILISLLWIWYMTLDSKLFYEFETYGIVFWILFLLILSSINIGTLLHPISVNIDVNSQIMDIVNILNKKEIIQLDMIAGFSVSIVGTKFRNFENIILYLTNGSVIELSEYNLTSVETIKNYLQNDRGIKCLGGEYTFFPFPKINYKYSKVINKVA